MRRLDLSGKHPHSVHCGRTSLSVLGVEGPVFDRRPALEQRAALVERNQAFHLIGASIEVVLQHLDGGVDFAVRAAMTRKLMRTGTPQRAP